jgi:hypothetical protein
MPTRRKEVLKTRNWFRQARLGQLMSDGTFPAKFDRCPRPIVYAVQICLGSAIFGRIGDGFSVSIL